MAIKKMIFYLFEALTIWFLFARIVYLATSIAGNNILVCAALFVVILFSFALIIFLFPKVKKYLKRVIGAIRRLPVWKMILIIVAVSVLTKGFLLLLLRIDSSLHPDIKMYWSFIQQLTENSTITENGDYAIRYPYTVMYSSFFLPFTKLALLFGNNLDSILYCNFYLVILHTVAAVLLFDTVKYYYGKNYAFVSSMMWVIILPGMLMPLYLCHENSFVVLNMVAVWIIFKVIPSTENALAKAGLFVISSLILAYLFTINKFGFVSVIAIIIVAILKMVNDKKLLKSIPKLMAVVLIFAVSLCGVKLAADNYVNNVTDNSLSDTKISSYEMPLGWTVFVGSNYEFGGVWNYEDKVEYEKFYDYSDASSAKEYQINLLKNRFNEYLKHPIRLPVHLNNKMKTISITFTPLTISFGAENFGSSFTDFIINGVNGYINMALRGFVAMINIYIAFVLVLSSRKGRNDDCEFVNYLKLLMLGVCAVLLVVEVSSKYSTILLPIYLTILTVNARSINDNIEGLNRKLKTKAFEHKRLK